MRLIIFFALIMSIHSCAQNKSTKSLIGKWKLIAESGSKGDAKIYTNKIKNGEILIFHVKQKLTNESGDEGKYKLDGNKLEINLNKKERFYLLFYDQNNSNKIYLSPVTPKYEIICDEGCSFIYERQ